jgi:hypothetical protein
MGNRRHSGGNIAIRAKEMAIHGVIGPFLTPAVFIRGRFFLSSGLYVFLDLVGKFVAAGAKWLDSHDFEFLSLIRSPKGGYPHC